MSDITKIYLNLSNDNGFCKAVAGDGRSYSPELFPKAVNVLQKIGSSPVTISDIETLHAKICVRMFLNIQLFLIKSAVLFKQITSKNNLCIKWFAMSIAIFERKVCCNYWLQWTCHFAAFCTFFVGCVSKLMHRNLFSIFCLSVHHTSLCWPA